jgi:hypothetical protein
LNPQRICDEEFHADPVFIPETWVRSTATTDTGNQVIRIEDRGRKVSRSLDWRARQVRRKDDSDKAT